MEEERQSLEKKRKILQKLKRLLDEWNDEFESMDVDVRQYFDKVDKDLKHLDKNLRSYFEKLSKEFEQEESEYKKQLKAQKKAECELAAAEACKLQTQPENANVPNDASEWTNEENQSAPQESNNAAGPSTDLGNDEEINRTTTEENHDSKPHNSRQQYTRGATRSGIIDMRALFEEAIANCTGTTEYYNE